MPTGSYTPYSLLNHPFSFLQKICAALDRRVNPGIRREWNLPPIKVTFNIGPPALALAVG
jgi:hypothetical protein